MADGVGLGVGIIFIVYMFLGVLITVVLPCCLIGLCVWLCITYSNQQGRNGQGYPPVVFGVPPPLQYQQPQLVQPTQYNPSAQVGPQGLQGYTSVQVDPNQVMQSQPPPGPTVGK